MKTMLTFEIDMPTPREVEKIVREECARIAGERGRWLRLKEAAAYLGISKKSFERNWKGKWGLPVSDLDGMYAFYIPDLDALRLGHVVTVPGTVVAFPSGADAPGELKVVNR